MLTKFRLQLKNGKYTYIEAKAVFNDFVEIHIIDRLKPMAGVSILETIVEVQEQILQKLGITKNILPFLRDTKWVLYGKQGEIQEYSFGDLVEMSHYHPLVDEQLREVALSRREDMPTENRAQLSLF